MRRAGQLLAQECHAAGYLRLASVREARAALEPDSRASRRDNDRSRACPGRPPCGPRRHRGPDLWRAPGRHPCRRGQTPRRESPSSAAIRRRGRGSPDRA